NPRQPWILPGFRIPGTGSQSLIVRLGFLIPILSRILDSLSCIPDSKAKDFGFYKKNFFGFEIPREKISQIPESRVPYIDQCKLIDLSKGTIKKISPRLHGTDAKKRRENLLINTLLTSLWDF
ncbi:unnamed protein product, partial [Porites evermanni]